MLILIQHVNLPYNLWGCVERTDIVPLVFRIIQGVITYYLTFLTIRFFNIGLVSIVNNLTPCILVLLAILLLKEKVSVRTWTVIGLAFISAVLVVVGGPGGFHGLFDNEDTDAGKTLFILAFIALFMNPIIEAIGIIALRKMRRLPNWTIITWMSFVNIIVFGVIMAAVGESFKYPFDNSWVAYDWFCLCGSSVTVIISSIGKFKAISNWKASKIAFFQFLCSIIQCIFDVTLLGVDYTVLQWMGFLTTCLIFCLELYGAFISSGEEEEAEKKRKAHETFDSRVNLSAKNSGPVITEDEEEDIDLTKSLIEDK